jgi:glycerophosphoryl diester phosphodiesterase
MTRGVPVTIAHRGDPVSHLENTVEAFESAVSLGASMVELDCRLTGDGHVVVLHDSTLERLWGVPRAVRSLSWEEVRAVRRNGYRIPDLAQVLGAVPLPVMVDVPGADVLEASLATVECARAIDRCLFAGQTTALRRLRELRPTASIALSWEKRELPAPELLLEVKPEWFNPHWRLVAPRVVEQMHEAGIGVSAWTVDHPWRIRRVLRAGVDAVITNRTARAIAAVRRREVARCRPSTE